MANPWMIHLKEYWGKHKGEMTYKQAMGNAKLTYTKKNPTQSSSVKKSKPKKQTLTNNMNSVKPKKKTRRKKKNRKANPWMAHLKQYWANNIGTMSYKQAMQNAKKTYKKK